MFSVYCTLLNFNQFVMIFTSDLPLKEKSDVPILIGCKSFDSVQFSCQHIHTITIAHSLPRQHTTQCVNTHPSVVHV